MLEVWDLNPRFLASKASEDDRTLPTPNMWTQHVHVENAGLEIIWTTNLDTFVLIVGMTGIEPAIIPFPKRVTTPNRSHPDAYKNKTPKHFYMLGGFFMI